MEAGFEAVIGLEVHVQLLTRSKMFCACRNEYGGAPNARTCPVCLGLPGALPALNGEAVRMAIALGLAVGGEIREQSTFYRKQYFYPDLPKGYQITQGPVAVVERGRLRIPGDPRARNGADGMIEAGIERAHLEEDAGKSNHELGEGASYVDLNRAGVPLLEIVGAPDLKSGQEAYDYLKAVHRLVTFLGICDGNLEEGSFRCDANVSVRRRGEPLGTRVEVKNLNSFRFVKQALDYEIERLTALVARGEAFGQETRGWDAVKGETRSQRSKEAAMDYRYFPEPDLPVLVITRDEIEAVRRALPELPEARFQRFTAQYGVSTYEAGLLLQSPAFADFFEAVAGDGLAKPAANWMLGEVSRNLNERSVGIQELGLAPEHLAALLRLVQDGTVNLNTAKEVVFPAMLAGAGAPAEIVAARGLGQVSDRGPIEALARAVLAANPGQLAQYLGGKENLKGFFVGQIMKAGKGKMNPALVNDVLDHLLAPGELQ
jgi:aspartyl-tRNA(Asn)/glutamyl-tRNA(Gln) amidotransferase subunit B